ncbi:hypothetical protein [Virgibacillus sp. CBA3643]|uniref:hypothetical protein n=1 Tax=Virgibacillus sp. CBA3643 TaxID=2942278 RepID=UPI0035A2BD96
MMNTVEYRYLASGVQGKRFNDYQEAEQFADDLIEGNRAVMVIRINGNKYFERVLERAL